MATQLLATRTASPTRPWRRYLLYTGVVFVIAVWAMPIVLAYSPFVGWVERRASTRIGRPVHIGELSLGWFSPVIASDVEINTASKQLVLRAGRIQSDRTLLGLLLHLDAPGGIRVEHASIEVVFEGKNSNLETSLGELLDTPPLQSGDDVALTNMPPCDVEIIDARVKLTDADAGRCWLLGPIQGNLRLFQDAATPVHARIQGVVGDDKAPDGIEATITITADEGAWKHGVVKGKVHGLPLGIAGPFLRRVMPGMGVTGNGDGQCSVAWTMDKGAMTELSAEASIGGQNCELTSPKLAETLVMDHFRGSCKLRIRGTELEISRSEFSCDLGHARYSGTVSCAARGLAWLDVPGHNVSLSLDLTRLADRLPKTLHIHPDLMVTAGQVRFEARSEGPDAGPVWTGRLLVTNIAGVRGTQPIGWEEPMVIDARARRIGQGAPLIEELRCTSGFLQGEGHAEKAGFRFCGDADLGKLADPLSRFVDLGPVRAVGQAHLELTVRSAVSRAGNLEAGADIVGLAAGFEVKGTGRVEDLHLEWRKGFPIKEDFVAIELVAKGHSPCPGIQSIESASLTAECAGDRVEAKLADAIPVLANADWGIWNLQITGNLARWQKRMQACTPRLDHTRIDGTIVVAARLRRDAEGLQCPSLSLLVRDFRWRSRGLWISEPTLDIRTAVSCDLAGSVELCDLLFECPSLTVASPRLVWAAGSAVAKGKLNLEGDLARLRAWMHDPRAVADQRFAGRFVGEVVLRPDGERLQFDFDLSLTDTGAAPALVSTSELTGVRAFGKGGFEPELDRLVLNLIRLESAFAIVDARGSVADIAGTRNIDFEGTLEYDMTQVGHLLRPYLGDDLEVSGKGSRGFRLAGAMAPTVTKHAVQISHFPSPAPEPLLQLRELKGAGAIGWHSLRTMGCDVGPTDLQFCLQKGWLQLYPVETTINGGTLRLQPNLRIDPGPVELVMLAGPIVEKARLTPAMCAGLLGHALPMLANAGDVDGTVSLSLDGGRIPVADPAGAEIKGKCTLHGVRVGVSPVVKELCGLLKVSPQAILVRGTEVSFHVVNGRVYHRDLEIVLPEFTVRTSGSVGLDGSLALLAEMPVPVHLIGSAKLSPALAKQVIRLPITGTLEQPRVDQRAVQAVITQLARELAADVLKQELERKLKNR